MCPLEAAPTPAGTPRADGGARAPDQALATLLALADAALAAVAADRLTATALARACGTADVLAVGKAAPAMARAALAAPGLTVRHALVITKHGLRDAALDADARVRQLTTGHPAPDAASFAAGRAAMRFVAGGPGAPALLVLLSGGASALMEAPAPGLTPAQLHRAHAWLVGSGWPIASVNRVRMALSAVKGGGLARRLGSRPARVLMLSDVPGNQPWAVGSGPFAVPPARPAPLPALPGWLARWVDRAGRAGSPQAAGAPAVAHRVIGHSATAARAAVSAARALGLPARNAGAIRGDAARAGARLAHALLAGPPGLTVWHGETTVRLCASPGQGGRNRHLALAAARVLDGHAHVALLALATDGEDHAGAAGAWADGATLAHGRALGLDADAALAACDSGSYFAAIGQARAVRATAGNVRDLVLGWRAPS